MKKIKIYLLLILVLLFINPIISKGRVLYVNHMVSDAADGLSLATAWKTTYRVSYAALGSLKRQGN